MHENNVQEGRLWKPSDQPIRLGLRCTKICLKRVCRCRRWTVVGRGAPAAQPAGRIAGGHRCRTKAFFSAASLSSPARTGSLFAMVSDLLADAIRSPPGAPVRHQRLG